MFFAREVPTAIRAELGLDAKQIIFPHLETKGLREVLVRVALYTTG